MSVTKILGRILGADEVIKSGVELIDSIHTSDEEEIKAKADAKVKIIEAYHPYKLAQRYLALMFTFTFLACFVLVLVMTLLKKGDVKSAIEVINEFWIGEIMALIIGFYFGGGFTESLRRKKDGGSV